MGTISNILKIILPAITTGLFTFFITKYTYNNNKPLDKIEIAYNRVYYPIYKIIKDKNVNHDINTVINKSKIYFMKYDKYIDISTKKLFESLCECKKEAKKKSIYRNFRDNIYNRHSYLRRRLGYLEPSFAQIYKYSSPTTKSLFRINIEFCIIYLFLVLSTITMNLKNQVYFNITLSVFLVFLMIIIIEIIWCFLRFIYFKIRK